MANMGSDSFSSQTSVWPLAILRVGLGYFFLKAAYYKFPDTLKSGKLAEILHTWVNGMPASWYPWYKTILVHNIIPHADIFAYLVVFGEFAVGLGLVLGFMTRPALFAGLFMTLNYYFACGYPFDATGTLNLLFTLAQLSLLFTCVGQAFGMDYFLSKKYPRIPLFK